MEKLLFETSAAPKVVLTANSDLTMKGVDELELVVKAADPDAVLVTQEEDTFIIKSSGACSVKVPRQSDVVIEAVLGNATLKALDGNLKITSVSGDLTLRSVADTSLDTLRGNLTAKNIMGDLTVNLIDGNATLRDVQGECKLQTIRGNLEIAELDGGLEAHVNGNASLSLDPAPGEDYIVTALGNISCNLADDASVNIQIEHAGRITLRLPGYSEVQNVNAPYQLTLGEGDARLKLSANGNLLISSHLPQVNIPDVNIDFEGEFEGMADMIEQQISQQIQAQLNMIEQQIQAQMANMTLSMGAAGLSPEQMERIQRRAREASERAAARAQEKIRQAQERLEKRMAAAQQRMGHKARIAEARAHHREGQEPPFWKGRPWTPPSPPAPPTEDVQVSDEERLMILRMLEQKKISLEEAERLLSALEGKE